MDPMIGRGGSCGGTSAGTSAGSSAARSAPPRSADEASVVAWLSQRQAAAAAGQPEAVPIAEVMASRRPAKCLGVHDDQVKAVDRLIVEIRARVRDPKLRVKPVHRVAWAVAEGRIPRPELYAVLDEIDRRRSGSSSPKIDCPGAYFVQSAKRLCTRFGVDWPAPQPR